MEVIWGIAIFGPLLAPLGAYAIGCLVWRGSFAHRRFAPIAWYYGSLAAVVAITHVCGGCRYDLTGNASGVCPECGEVISQEQRELLAQRESERRFTTPSKR